MISLSTDGIDSNEGYLHNHCSGGKQMSLDQAQAFITEAHSNQDLRQQIAALQEEETGTIFQRIVVIGSASGFDFTADELKQAWKEHQISDGNPELNDEELDGVIGGNKTRTHKLCG